MGANLEHEIEQLVAEAWEEHQTEQLVDHYTRVAIRFIQQHDPCTWLALENHLVDQGMHDVNGDCALLLNSGGRNVAVWAAMSKLFIRIMRRVMMSNRVVYQPAPAAVYASALPLLGLPVADEPRDYATLHLYPVFLCIAHSKALP